MPTASISSFYEVTYVVVTKKKTNRKVTLTVV